MLVDEGLLVEEDGRYRVVGDVSRMAVPETLQALIAARIDGLDAAERAVLQDAAILGQSFTVAGLAALTERPGSELEDRLRGLVRKEVLVLDADPRSPERGQYGFVQSVIREVAHETISKRDRRAKHLAAARYFETLADEELAGVLASHYLQAYEATSAGPEAEALAAQARVALRAAADRAAALYSHDQALAFLEQAEAVTSEPGERVALWERMAEAARAVARFDVTERRLDQAIEWHSQQGDLEAVARDTARLAEAALRAGRVEPALERLLKVERDGLSSRAVGRLSAVLGRAYMLHEEYQTGFPEIERALVAAGEAEDVETVAEALATKGPIIGELHRFDEAVAVLHGAVALAESHGLVGTQLRASFNLAGRLYSDDPAAAFRVLREGLELARRLGQRGWFNALAGFAVGAAIDAGDWDWASALADEVFQGEVPALDRLNLGVWVAVLEGFRGRSTEAESLLDELAPILDGVSNIGDRGIYWWARSNVATAAGRFEDGYEAGLKAAEINPANAAVAHTLAASAAVLLGDSERVRRSLEVMERVARQGRFVRTAEGEFHAALLAFKGKRSEAARQYMDVIRRFRDLGTPVPAAVATIEAVTLLGTEDPLIRSAAEEARAALVKLAAEGLLQRLDDAIARGPVASTAALEKPAARSAAERVPASPQS
jgi:tetratricopeptide (TPR) repeat protein